MKRSNAYERFLNRPIAALMLYCAVLFLGVVAAARLPVELLPDLAYPRLIVFTEAPGLSADEVEREVVVAQESLLAGLPQLRRVEAIADEGYALLSLTFTRIGDLDATILNVREKLASFLVRDPIAEPSILHHDPNARPVAVISVTAPETSLASLTSLAHETFVRRLTQLDGVGRVTVVGGAREWRTLNLDPATVASNRISRLQIRSALQARISRIGTVREGRNSYSVRLVEGTADRLEELAVPGTPFQIGDLGRLTTTTEYDGAVATDGRRGVALIVEKRYGANTIEVVDAIRSALPSLTAYVSEETETDVALGIAFQEATFIEDAMASVINALGLGGVLTLLVLVLSLGSLRQGIAVALSIPFSVAASALLFFVQGLTFNIMSLGGLALGIGMMVDNSIVVSEAVHRQLRISTDRVRAVRLGVEEVAAPVTASTLTTVAVFIPIVFLSGPTALLFRDLALAVATSLLLSLIVSVTLLPVLLGRIGGYGRFGSLVGSFWEAAVNRYTPLLERLNRGFSFVMIGSIVVLAVAVWGAVELPRELLPESGQQRIVVEVSAPAGTMTERLYTQMEQLVRAVPGELAETTMITAGRVRDERVGLSLPAPSEGRIRIGLNPSVGVESARDTVTSRLNRVAETLSLSIIVRAEANPLEDVLGSGAGGVVLRFSGPAEPAFTQIAERVVGALTVAEGTPSTLSGMAMRPVYDLRLRSELLRVEGIPASRVIAELEHIFRPERVERLTDSVLVTAGSDASFLEAIQTPVSIGTRIYTIGNLVDFVPSQAPARIYRVDQRRSVDMTFAVQTRDRQELAERLEVLSARLGSSLPDGYSLGLAGDELEAERSLQGLGWAFLVALALVYMIMAAQFESLLLPLGVILSVPMALTGVVGLFYLTGDSLNVMSAIGAIVALGIVINDAIILTSAMREIEREESSAADHRRQRHPALLAAARRLRPIVVTTATTVAGMLPLALAGEAASRLRAPLALAVIGGLVSATALTLIVLPVVFARLRPEARSDTPDRHA
ncbi:MAG: efflux RND transporter permease subunit [Spirochaetota bacterium]